MIAVDLFAGGGGASLGIQQALGVAPIVAVNHDQAAIDMHAANHPNTIHLCEDVFSVSPLKVARGHITRGRCDLLWASPDCTHHSRAKGGKPRDNKRRGLAWVVVDWAHAIAPRVICLENVPEFEQWGPLDDEGQPIKARAGETFQAFVGQLKLAGYKVERRVLNAADYGAPTSRKRLFIVARRDGPVRWPAPTHGPTRLHPWRTAAECIDWSIPCPSIFDRKKPLAEATQRRIAEGIRRYVLTASKPFLVNLTHGARVESVDEPARTVTAAHRGEKAVVTPFLSPVKSWGGGGNGPRSVEEPMRTTTTSKRGEHAVVAPILVRTDMQSDGRLRGVGGPQEPLRTVTSSGGHAVAAAMLVQTGYGERGGQAPRALNIEAPLGTVVAGGSKHAVVAAWLAKHYGGVVGQPLDKTIGTVTAVDHHSLVACTIESMYSNSRGSSIEAPLGTVTAGDGGHHALVAAFLLKFYSNGGQWSGLDEAMHTVVSKARMGLVTVMIEGEEYVIVDIGMRMLTPRELARAQGFPDDYLLTGTKTEQIARIGNSVCPPVARAVVEAQFEGEIERMAAK